MADFATSHKAGVDAIYAAMGIDVTYRKANGVESSVTVIAPWLDEREDVGYGKRAPERSRLMSVRLSEIAEPLRGDCVTIADGTHEGIWNVDAIDSNDGIEAVLVVH